jgi:hypothetical protein
VKKLKKQNHTKVALFAGATAFMAFTPQVRAQSTDDVLINKLEQKGILTVDEAKEIREESAAEQTNLVNSALMATKFKMAASIKNMQFYGDLRLRYEYRGVDNIPANIALGGPSTFYRERMRYALRFGIRGDLYDNFNYGIRLETSTNPRSPWATFGNNTTSGSVAPSDKAQSGIGIGQAYIGWHPASWFEVTAGRMPMPLYTTPMVWSSNLNPEGAFEKFKYTIGGVDLFADFAQFDYQDPSSVMQFPSSDTFLLAWQAGANVRLGKDMSFKVAPMLYTYAGVGAGGGLNSTFVGQGLVGQNVGVPGGANVTLYNEEGINNLLILEIPAEFEFKIWKTPVGTLQARLFGDFAYNFQGADRASGAYKTNPGAFPGLSGPETGQNKAYQIGFGVGSDGPVYGPTQGLVYGSTSKKNTWEARVYWQHIEQYALDVNLLDGDFFEGRANLQGVYSAFAYSFTDAIIGTVRYGYANPIKSNLGTGGNNLDIPGINPVNNYNVFQADLTWRF